jgi:D-alanyl-lipoteichoic acid acyltransferase DltB (MBOAT superfamily)
MLFNSALYAAFLLGTYAVFWLLRGHHALRTIFLILASYGFYVYGTYDAALEEEVPLGPVGWSALCFGIIFVGSSLDYGIGRLLGRVTSPGSRKALLLVSVFYYLGVLALFKYWNFGADTFAWAMQKAGIAFTPTHLRLALPFGISFFTFETMSYTIDVYRREIEPAKSYKEYLLFVCFFPHLVAGPIVRPHQMLPQLATDPVVTEGDKARALSLIATGLAKKIVIGDTLAQNLVGRVFDNPERYSSLEGLVAIYAYAIQIYADFSGYTDVAIGSAKLFGYDLPYNFDAPYTSRDLQEFWRKWHISLSTWLRDYLYVPLGGNRHGTGRTYFNLLATMVLGGLWHGASWNFVLWGALHGGALAVNRAWQRASRMTAKRDASAGPYRSAADGAGPKPVQQQSSPLGTVISVFCTFHFVCFCWVFFRAPSFGHALLLLSRLGKGTISATNLPLKVVVVLLTGMALHFVPKRVTDQLRDAFARAPAPVQGIVLAACAFGLHAAAGTKAEPFVYGQF